MRRQHVASPGSPSSSFILAAIYRSSQVTRLLIHVQLLKLNSSVNTDFFSDFLMWVCVTINLLANQPGTYANSLSRLGSDLHRSFLCVVLPMVCSPCTIADFWTSVHKLKHFKIIKVSGFDLARGKKVSTNSVHHNCVNLHPGATGCLASCQMKEKMDREWCLSPAPVPLYSQLWYCNFFHIRFLSIISVNKKVQPPKKFKTLRVKPVSSFFFLKWKPCGLRKSNYENSTGENY